MAELRIIKCDIKGCKAQQTETQPGEGWAGWGALHGIALNGIPNPHLCPAHLFQLAEFVDKLEEK